MIEEYDGKWFKMFSDMVRKADNIIEMRYHGGAINWIDKNFDNAWSNALDRIDKAWKTYESTRDHKKFEVEVKIYKTNCLNFLQTYREHFNLTENNNKLNELKNRIKQDVS